MPRRLENLQTALKNAQCPDPQKMNFTGDADTFDPKDLGTDYFCRDAQQAYDTRRQALTLSALNKAKEVIGVLEIAIVGFAGQCPEGAFLQMVSPDAITVCNDISTGRLKHGEKVHDYLVKKTGLEFQIMYSGENFKDLNRQLIEGGINQPDLLILPSPKMT